jgi:hypothetical protein
MRLIELLTTENLQEEITREYLKLNQVIKKELDINFCINIENADDGEYVYADESGYHYVYCERGNVERNKITDDVFEIVFWALCPMIIRASFEYELKNRNEELNSRKVAFDKQIEFWTILGDNFKKRGEIEIDENLKVNPL